MGRIAVLVLALSALAHGQKQQDWGTAWQRAMDEAGASQIDAIRAFETFLAKFPNSPQTDEAERYLARAALDAKDDRRIALYGEHVLKTSAVDMLLLDRVARAQLALGGAENAKRALEHARTFEQIVRGLAPPEGRDAAKKQDERDRGLSRMLDYQSRAQRVLGDLAEAERLASLAFRVFPNEESAREWAETLVSLGRIDYAVLRYAEAFAVPDARAAEAERAADRKIAGELYAKLHNGSQAGLGDLILAAYDHTSAMVAERAAKLRAIDPNLAITDPMEFTLTKLDGSKLALRSLRGKVLVLDFWATWCQPCRVQHPLYEELKKRFRDRKDVLFLSIDTDEDRNVVGPFLDQIGWGREVYFEDGLQKLLGVQSIPSTLLFDKQGRLASRMNGFIPDSFVEQISDRIRAALGETAR